MAAKNTKLINDLFGRKAVVTHDPDSFWPLPSELIGLEIEIEDPSRSESIVGWSQHSDGSLRNGTEYVLSGPTGGRQLTEAINAFFDSGLTYTVSPRTSIHVHINASDNMTVDQFRNMFVLMYLIEPAVFRWADENRKWCGYCAPLTDLTPGRIINILNDTRDDVRFVIAVRGDGNSDRYYGFNVAAYHRHGTVEFRYFPCTTDRERVIEWVKFCMYVKKAARRHGSPEDILALMQTQTSLTNFINEWFGDVAVHILRNLDIEDCLGRVKDMGTMVNVAPESLRNPESYHRVVRSRGFNRYVTRSFPDAQITQDEAPQAATTASDALTQYLSFDNTMARVSARSPSAPSSNEVSALRGRLAIAQDRLQRAIAAYQLSGTAMNHMRVQERQRIVQEIQHLIAAAQINQG